MCCAIRSFSLVSILLLLFIHSTKAESDCDCVHEARLILEDSFFAQQVYKVEKELKDAQAACKSQDPFSYYDHSGQCHQCKNLCDNPEATLECRNLCESYLIYLNYTSEYNPLREEIKEKDERISSLQLQIFILFGFFGLTILAVIVVFIWQLIYNKWTYQRLRIEPPIGDMEKNRSFTKRKIIAKQETATDSVQNLIACETGDT